MIANREFDASELSSSGYITRYVAGDRSFVAIPVLPSRVFRHSFIVVNSDRIKNPSDLNGKRIGVQLYTMTAAVWIRGLLQHEYGVDLSSIEWVEGKMEGPGMHGKTSALPPLKPVMITSNENLPECLGRAPHISRLFPDFKAVEQAYYNKTGIFPIMHLVAIRREVYEKHKFVGSALFNALSDSKNTARARMMSTGALRYMLPWLPAELNEIKDVFGDDCWPYEVEPNRRTLEALFTFLEEQSMIERKVTVEELFAPVREIYFKIG